MFTLIFPNIYTLICVVSVCLLLVFVVFSSHSPITLTLALTNQNLVLHTHIMECNLIARELWRIHIYMRMGMQLSNKYCHILLISRWANSNIVQMARSRAYCVYEMLFQRPITNVNELFWYLLNFFLLHHLLCSMSKSSIFYIFHMCVCVYMWVISYWTNTPSHSIVS